ncbi:MAG: polynucleotide adenylyltransferase PcnB [Methylophilaceae bacterium]
MNSNFLQNIQKKIESLFRPETINHSLINENALNIIKNLKQNNYEAYIVGGAVRDILMNHSPKDFDVATNATPEEVKSLFRRSRIIGRRFKLVHVIYGREIIEVSTFRANPTQKIHMSNGVLKDNEFGTINEDAARRDFTINALYYDPERKKLIDFYGGVNDIKNKKIKLIGNPKLRYKEDPIRLIRAIRFSAKLKMDIYKSTKDQINTSLKLLNKVPYSRLFDEIMKLFLTGHAIKSFSLFKTYKLSNLYFPILNKLNDSSNKFILQALKDTDARILKNKSVNPGFLLAIFLWQDVLDSWRKNKHKYAHPSISLNEAIDKTLYDQNKIFPIQKRYSIAMGEIWRLQPRFSNLSPKKIYRLLGHPRFRAAYDFMLLRSQTEKAHTDLASWWKNFVSADDATKKILLNNKIKKKHA